MMYKHVTLKDTIKQINKLLRYDSFDMKLKLEKFQLAFM